ncbi:VOC family protein [Hyphococcus flavus]|uniref:VOC family protein n=1 Tax=Hyphococcus flavus TaxID=1866326 RepID=A0AAE9ZC00_9PROT|nr:VOC family protein [Hyphococcus flavus]WDI30605.1 VOC family protein [Hyphococcus flavus]
MTSWKSPNRSVVTPIIMVKDAMKTMDFVSEVFGGEVVGEPLMRGDGSLWNAEVKIGDTNIMFNAPPEGHEIPGFIYVHVADADATFEKAVAAGAEPIMKPMEQFYGEYDGGFKDKQGNIWWVSTHRKVLPPGEIEKAAREFEAQMAKQS